MRETALNQVKNLFSMYRNFERNSNLIFLLCYQEYSNLSPEDRTAIGMRADEMVKLCLVRDTVENNCFEIFHDFFGPISGVGLPPLLGLLQRDHHEHGDQVRGPSLKLRKSQPAVSNSFMHPSRGNCFIFNSEGQMGEMLAGPRSGIAIDLALSRHEYPWRPTNDLEGVRVVLHGPDEIPLPEENGMDLLVRTTYICLCQNKKYLH